MIEYCKDIQINTLNGGFVEYFKLPSDCKVIRKISFATDLYYLIKTELYQQAYQSIIRNFVRNFKNIFLGKISFAINNANENIIFDYSLYFTQKAKFGIENIRDKANFEVIIESPLNYVIDIYAPYIQNSLCKLVFKYNDIIQEIKTQGILPDGTSIYAGYFCK
jgi:hypothetical protein